MSRSWTLGQAHTTVDEWGYEISKYRDTSRSSKLSSTSAYQSSILFPIALRVLYANDFELGRSISRAEKRDSCRKKSNQVAITYRELALSLVKTIPVTFRH